MSKIKDTIKEGEVDNEYKYIDENKSHLHTYLGKPLLGTSTVVGVLSKNLTWWSAELSAVECLEVGEKIPTIREEYLEAKKKGKEGIDELQKKYPVFKKARFAHFVDKNEKADKGTDMHEVMENYVVMCLELNNGYPIAYATDNKKLEKFVNWALLNVEKFVFSEKHVYSSKLWTGGIFDLMFLDKNKKMCLGDFKSSKECYDSQFIQIAGYDLQQSENGVFNSDGYKIGEPQKIEAYYVFPFGDEDLKVGVRYNVEELKKGFDSCCTLYKLTNY